MSKFNSNLSATVTMIHIVSNIRNLDKFLKCFPWLASDPAAPGSDVEVSNILHHLAAPQLVRAGHYDLVIAKVTSPGATVTEDREGNERPLLLGEWLVAPLIGRESNLGHSSILPLEGVAIGSIIDYISTGGGLGISPDNPAGMGDPTKVQVLDILRYHDGRIARSLDFAIDVITRPDKKLSPVIAVIGSCSGAGKTTACIDLLRQFRRQVPKTAVAKLSGTMQKKEILELAIHAAKGLDMADAGLPTTTPPSQEDDDRAFFTVNQVLAAADRNLRALSADNDLIMVECGGDMLSASVPRLLEDPARLNITALIMVAETPTAAIGMETKLFRISERYESIPRYVVGPATNLQGNRNRVRRETSCLGCYDIWTKHSEFAPEQQIKLSEAHTEELGRKLLKHCGL